MEDDKCQISKFQCFKVSKFTDPCTQCEAFVQIHEACVHIHEAYVDAMEHVYTSMKLM